MVTNSAVISNELLCPILWKEKHSQKLCSPCMHSSELVENSLKGVDGHLLSVTGHHIGSASSSLSLSF